MTQGVVVNTAVLDAMVEARTRVPRTVTALLRYFDIPREELAQAMGLTRQSIHNKLNGRTVLRHEEVAGLARFFGVPADVLRLEPDVALRWVLDHPEARPAWLEFPRNR